MNQIESFTKEQAMVIQPLAVNRRAAIAALGLSMPLLTSRAGAADDSATEAGLKEAVENLRVAMLAGDRPALERLLDDEILYMHSSGFSQSKTRILQALVGTHFFADLTYAEQTFQLFGAIGIAALTVDQNKNLTNGATRASRIKVMQTWQYKNESWRLLARMSAILSTPPKPHTGSAVPAS